MASQRTPFYDNLKFILITLVLIGHFTEPLLNFDLFLKAFWRWIYMFHMPAFLFVGGVFAKKLYTPEKGLRVNVIAFYLVMCVAMYTGLWVERHLWSQYPTYNLFNLNSIPWYFAAIAALGASTPIIAKIRGGIKTVVPSAVLVALIVPFNDNFNDFLALGRICAYAPFYFAGYYISIPGFVEWVKRTKAKRWPVVLAGVFMIAIYLALLLLPGNVTGTMSGLATGHNTYQEMKSFPSYIDALIRLCDILIAGLMIAAVSVLTPTKRMPFSDLGKRTLQVYFFHPFIYYPLTNMGFYSPLEALMPYSGWAMALVAIAVAFLLSWPKWPEKMFHAIRTAIKIDKNP